MPLRLGSLYRIVTLAVLLALLLAGTRPSMVGAQTPATDSLRRAADSLALDSLRERLARAEAAIALLRQQLAVENQSAVHSRSRLRVELSAQVLTNIFFTEGSANITDVPLTALPPAAPAAAPSNGALGFTLRQTRVGAAASVTDVAGGTFSGDVDLDFFESDPYGAGDRPLFPLPRLRTARARLIWARTELEVGSDTPLISDLNPVSLAAIGIPDFSAAGNLWNWLGQVRLSRELATLGAGPGALRLAVQGAVMDPNASQEAFSEPTGVDAGERSRRPAVEARLRARWGDEDQTISDALITGRGGEIGIGMHRSWVATAPGVLVESHAATLDAHAVLAPGIELRGEGYAGRLLRGLGGGGIAQNFGAPPVGAPAGTLGPPLRDVAGWAQLNVQPHPVVLAGIGCGIDLADHRDNPVRRQNTACAAHAEWRPAQPVVIGLELRQIGTRYATGTHAVRHVNLAFGFEL